MSNHDPERAYVQSRLDHADHQLNEAAAEMEAQVNALRESWSSGYAEQLADHEVRMRKLDEDHQAWLRSLYTDAGDEPAHADVAGGQGHAPAGRNAPASPGPVPQQPNPAAGLTADDIKGMSLAEYGRRRAELGVRSAESMSRLSG